MNTENQKGDSLIWVIVFIIIALILVGLAYGVYYLIFRAQYPPASESLQSLTQSNSTSEKTPTEWNTYTSNDKSISFQYPAQWQVEPEFISEDVSVITVTYNTTPVFELTIEKNYNQTTQKPYKDLDELLTGRMGTIQDKLVAGYEAKIIEDQWIAGHVIAFTELVLLSSDKENIIRLYYKPDSDSGNDSDKILDQILDSFLIYK